MLNLHHNEVKIAQEALILEKCIDLIGLIPDEKVFALAVGLLYLLDQVRNTETLPRGRVIVTALCFNHIFFI